MAIKVNDIITKDDIFEVLISKDYVKKNEVSVSGTFVGYESASKEGYLWIRNNSADFLTSPWSAGTTYAIKNRVTDNGEVYTSTSNGNIGNDPSSETDEANWHRVPNGVVITDYKNMKFTSFTTGGQQQDDYTEEWVWRVSWDGLGEEILTQVWYDKRSGVNAAYEEITLPPGYYKYKLYVRSWGAVSTQRLEVEAKQYANDIDQFDQIRVFTPDWKELQAFGAENVTVALAKSGRLTTTDYYGGDYQE